ncbi:MAG: PmoA family protein [Caldilineaceae bacterium]|nr:PmoA family protein [Caldilineaceae bacterium]
MANQSHLQNFSLEGDQVALPKGAWAQSHRLNVRWRGRDLTALSQGHYRAYLFPVYTPAGFALTSESPLDHPHHNSLWIGADHVNCYLPFANDTFEEASYNFYVNDIFQGRAPGRILSVDVEAEELAADHLRLTQTLHWQGPVEWGAPQRRTLAVETRTIDIRPGQTANLFDVRSHLRAAEWELRIGPTRHAYFGLRMTEALRVTAGAVLIDSAGRSGGQAISRQISDWVDCSGTIAAGRSAGAALFPYPSAQDFPWFVSDWGTLTVNPLARKQYQLQPGEALDFAVRVVAHDGDAEQADIAGLYRSFARKNSADIVKQSHD